MHFIPLSALIALLPIISAIPTTPPEPLDNLHKRGIETVYLAECTARSGPTAYPTYSRAVYYGPNTSSWDNNPPDDMAAASNGYANFVTVLWEGQTVESLFPSGVLLTTEIEAGPFAAYDVAGTADNGYRQFTCYRDNDRPLFTRFSTGSGAAGPDQCYAEYYCI